MAVLRYISLLLLIVVSVSFVASDDDDDDSLRCLKVVIPDNVCAILYDDENCLHRPLIGWKKELGEGEEELGFRYRNDAESVIVKKGCTFRGYDHKRGLEGLLNIADGEDQVEERGDAIAVVADGTKNKAVTFEDSDRGEESDLDDDISYVSCRCGNKESCAPVPPYLCAIAYDKPKCKTEGSNWDTPFEIAEVTDLKLTFWKHFKAGNDIESVSVRAGCVFEGWDKSDRTGEKVTITAAASGQDVHRDLTSLKDSISSIRCTCSN